MSIYNFPGGNRTGFDPVISDTANAVYAFTPMFLVFVFVLVFLSGYTKQRRETGNGDAPVWATLAGVVTSMVALLLTLGSGAIRGEILAITFAVTIGCALWLFFSRDK